MSKKKKRQQRSKTQHIKDQNQIENELLDREFAHTIKSPKKPKRARFEPKTQTQGLYTSSIVCNQLTFGTGPAGTGKTFVASAIAAEMLQNGDIEKIVITRPAVQIEEDHGALPGELDEKFDPYLQPFIDAFEKLMGKSKVEYLRKRKVIDAQPLAYMRGSNFDDAFVILDEAQNCTPKQMKMFLTRICENSRVVVNGDIDQVDIKGPSGLNDAIHRFDGMKGASVIEFDEDDVVRSGIVREILKRYR